MVDGTYATIYDLLYSATKASNLEIVDYVLNQLDNADTLDTDEKSALTIFNSS